MVSSGEVSKAPIKKPEKKKPEKEFLTLKARGFPCQTKKKDIRSFFLPLKPASIRLPPKVKGVAYVGFLTEKEFKKALDKHRSVYGSAFNPNFHLRSITRVSSLFRREPYNSNEV